MRLEKNGSVIKCTYALSSQQLYVWLKIIVTLALGDLVPSSGLHCPYVVHMHSHNNNNNGDDVDDYDSKAHSSSIVLHLLNIGLNKLHHKEHKHFLITPSNGLRQ